MRPFRFGLAGGGKPTGAEWTDHARKVEGMGFSTLVVPDHYVAPMSTGPLLVAAAAATTKLRLGSLVYDNDFRHPALLAKEAATIDLLSDGRFEFGIGAGWHKPEYDQVGVPFDEPGIRAGRLEEAISIIRMLHSGEEVTFEGKHYQITGFKGAPKPVQDPLPLFIGGGGPRLLRLAAREAQIVGIAAKSLKQGGIDAADMSGASMDNKVRWIDEETKRVGRQDAPERNVLTQGLITGEDVDARLSQIGEMLAVEPQTIKGSPHFLVGSQEEIIDEIQTRRERWGVSYYVIFDRDLDAAAPIVQKLAGS